MRILLFFTMLGLVTGQPNPPSETSTMTGEEWVNELENNYKEGKYKGFLAEMDRYFEEGQSKNAWQPLIDSEKELLQRYNTPQGKQLFEELFIKGKQYNNEINQIKRTRNEELKRVASFYPNASNSKMIKDRLNEELSTKELQSLELFQEWLSPFPLHTETPLLKQLKEINFESNVKEMLLNAAYKEGHGNKAHIPYFGKLNASKMDEYQVILTLDKLEKMQKAAKNSREQDIKDVLNSVSVGFPIIAAQIYDSKVIEKEIQNPTTQAEQETAKVIQAYDKKRNETLKKYGLIR